MRLASFLRRCEDVDGGVFVLMRGAHGLLKTVTGGKTDEKERRDPRAEAPFTPRGEFSIHACVLYSDVSGDAPSQPFPPSVELQGNKNGPEGATAAGSANPGRE